LVVSYVVEEASFINTLLEKIPGGDATVVQLAAKQETLESRLKEREKGSELVWYINRAGELLTILADDGTPCDYRIHTDNRSVADIASEIVHKIEWRLD